VIEDAITERGLSKSILLLGLRNDVPSLMSKSDVFLFPSIYEGFGLVAIEANAAGLPVVCSRIPGLVEAVQDGETALLHDVKDIAGMAQSVVKLLDDRTYREQLGHAGQSLVKNQYSTEKSATHLLEIYNSFVS
jgi:glycosyltransferase involved in cell wall biosynthesis